MNMLVSVESQSSSQSLSGLLFSTNHIKKCPYRIGRASHLIAVTSRYEYVCVCRVSVLKPVIVRSFVSHEIISRSVHIELAERLTFHRTKVVTFPGKVSSPSIGHNRSRGIYVGKRKRGGPFMTRWCTQGSLFYPDLLMMYSKPIILSKPADVSKNSLFYPNLTCFIQIQLMYSKLAVLSKLIYIMKNPRFFIQAAVVPKDRSSIQNSLALSKPS